MDRNSILSGFISSFSSFADADSRGAVEKVFKYSGEASDMMRRADIKSEAVVFRLQSASTEGLIEDDKPLDLDQTWDALIFVEQGDSHSIKEARYDRMLEITDQLIDWSINASPAAISADLYTLTLTGATPVVELEGYLSTTLSFSSIIKIQ